MTHILNEVANVPVTGLNIVLLDKRCWDLHFALPRMNVLELLIEAEASSSQVIVSFNMRDLFTAYAEFKNRLKAYESVNFCSVMEEDKQQKSFSISS